MGCFCSKQNNARVFDDMHELYGSSLISQLDGNDSSTLAHLFNRYPNHLKITRHRIEDDRGEIRLHQCRELQLIPIEGNMKKFVFGREGIEQEVGPNEGDVLFIMPFGTLPDIVIIEQGCHLSIAKIRTMLEPVTLRLTGRALYRWRRRRFRPVSIVSTGWVPDFEMALENA